MYPCPNHCGSTRFLNAQRPIGSKLAVCTTSASRTQYTMAQVFGDLKVATSYYISRSLSGYSTLRNVRMIEIPLYPWTRTVFSSASSFIEHLLYKAFPKAHQKCFLFFLSEACWEVKPVNIPKCAVKFGSKAPQTCISRDLPFLSRFSVAIKAGHRGGEHASVRGETCFLNPILHLNRRRWNGKRDFMAHAR